MTKEIKYIGFYDLPDSKFKRVSSPPAVNKMDYICEALNQAGYSVHIISPSWTLDTELNAKYQTQQTLQLSPKKRVTFCPTISTSTKQSRNFKIILTLFWLFFWLIFNTKRNEKILMYHVPWLALPVIWAKRIKGFKLVLEVEEVYGDVSSIHPYFDKIENKVFCVADSFFYSTDLLINRLGSERDHTIIYGAYKTYPKGSKINDGKIHLLYAGIIDSHKAGAFNAIESALFLPANYVMHVIGFGEVDKLKRRIEQINKESACKVIFDGSKIGDDYINYCQNCHIGLSTQTNEGKYLETSFPSKILSYLSLGLRVVSCKIKCVEMSKVNRLMTYYDDNSPKSIAEAIMTVNIEQVDFDSNDAICDLNGTFVDEIKVMFKDE